MRSPDERSDSSLALLADSAGWRVLSLLFQRPAPGWGAQLEAMAGEVGDPALLEAVDLALPASEGVYLSMLGPGGSVSARETGHQPLRDPGWLLADLSSFYRAFHYSPKGEDPPDHIATEVGFAAFLRLKESYAQRAGRAVEAEVTRRALSQFLRDHLSAFGESFHDRLEATGGPPYLVVAANLLAKKVESLGSLVEIEV